MVRTLGVVCLVAGTLARLYGQGANEKLNTTDVTKPSDRTILVTRSFKAPRQRVFDALTRMDQVPRWFQSKQMSLESYEADLKIGGSYRYVFRRPGGRKIEMRGIYKEIEAPNRLVYTETYDFSPLTLLVTTVLDEAQGKTVLTQTIVYASKQERDGDFDAVATSTAELYVKLEHYLESATLK